MDMTPKDVSDLAIVKQSSIINLLKGLLIVAGSGSSSVSIKTEGIVITVTREVPNANAN